MLDKTESALTNSKSKPTIRLLRVPHPYKAMLAICSDLDETPDRHVYGEIARFLNTTETTRMGPGVGLEVGNTIYFDMSPDQFAYWNTDDAGRAMVRAMIRSGHIDCLHSYGDLATTRAHAGRALDELDHHGCKLPVWVDHGTAVTNFGADIMHGHGDEPEHPAYHADLTMGHGIRYVWCGRVTSVIGQDVSPRYGGIANWRYPLTSAKTVGKEITKRTLGRFGHAKYQLQAPNQVMGERQLRDGQILPEFIRCNPHFGGVSCCEKGRDIHHVLTPRLLDVLVKRQGICILYTHLGKLNDSRMFDPPAVEALRYLAEQMRLQRVLVTTTARLLDYLFWRDRLQFRYVRRDRQAEIVVEPTSELTNTADSIGYQGLSFEVPGDGECRLVQASGERLETQTTFKSGHRQILSIPWDRLRFPDWG